MAHVAGRAVGRSAERPAGVATVLVAGLRGRYRCTCRGTGGGCCRGFYRGPCSGILSAACSRQRGLPPVLSRGSPRDLPWCATVTAGLAATCPEGCHGACRGTCRRSRSATYRGMPRHDTEPSNNVHHSNEGESTNAPCSCIARQGRHTSDGELCERECVVGADQLGD